jgi:hypothetical protein
MKNRIDFFVYKYIDKGLLITSRSKKNKDRTKQGIEELTPNGLNKTLDRWETNKN